MVKFLWSVWQGVIQSMALNPRAAEVVEQSPQAGRVVLTIAILGGIGLLLGQSVILFVNQVQPGRFVLSLLVNGLAFAASLAIWAIGSWISQPSRAWPWS